MQTGWPGVGPLGIMLFGINAADINICVLKVLSLSPPPCPMHTTVRKYSWWALAQEWWGGDWKGQSGMKIDEQGSLAAPADDRANSGCGQPVRKAHPRCSSR